MPMDTHVHMFPIRHCGLVIVRYCGLRLILLLSSLALGSGAMGVMNIWTCVVMIMTVCPMFANKPAYSNANAVSAIVTEMFHQ